MEDTRRRSFKDKAKEKLGSTKEKLGNTLDKVKNKSIEVKKQFFQEDVAGEKQDAETANHEKPLDTPITKAEVKEKPAEKEKIVHIQPKGTMCYIVNDRDTLAGIAAHYDTTPSELAKLNKMGMSRHVFPGQKMYVPDKDYESNNTTSPCASPTEANNKEKEQDIVKSKNDGKSSSSTALDKSFFIGGKEFPVVQTIGAKPEKNQQDSAANDWEIIKPDLKTTQKMDQECHERFIKVTVKHITDGQGVVNGVLLVTPNAIMFDPDVMDRLVMEHGAEQYGMIAPMETIISAAIYHDIAAMKLSMAENDGCQSPDTPKPEVYHSRDCPLYGNHMSKNQPTDDQSQSSHKSEDTENSVQNADKVQGGLKMRSSSSCSCKSLGEVSNPVGNNSQAGTISDIPETSQGADSVQIDSQEIDGTKGIADTNTQEAEKNEEDKSDKSIGIEDALADVETKTGDHEKHVKELPALAPLMIPKDVEPPGHSPTAKTTQDYIYKPNIPPVSNTSEEQDEKAKTDDTKANIVSRTWDTISSVGSFVSHSPGISTIVDFSSGLFARTQENQEKSSDETETTRPITKTDAMTSSGIEVENVVKLDDKPQLFQSLEELIPRPAVLYEDPPLYLCLKIGKPINKRVSKTCPVQSYMKRKRKPEYWFSIPRNRVDNLYAFFIQWSPSIYGSEGEDADRGFMPLDSDEEELEMVDDYFVPDKQIAKQMSKNWEIVNKEEIKRRESLREEETMSVPDMADCSTILSDTHIKKLSRILPPRAVGYCWKLVYSSDKHGFSLKTLYRAMDHIDSPTLVVVKDSHDHIFGSLTSCALKVSESFYGTGESFLYTFYPEFVKYGWTGENNFFIKGNAESLSIGAGEGSFGLWIDGDIYHGRTQHCQTYNNQILTDSEDFMVKCMEAWVFE